MQPSLLACRSIPSLLRRMLLVFASSLSFSLAVDRLTPQTQLISARDTTGTRSFTHSPVLALSTSDSIALRGRTDTDPPGPRHLHVLLSLTLAHSRTVTRSSPHQTRTSFPLVTPVTPSSHLSLSLPSPTHSLPSLLRSSLISRPPRPIPQSPRPLPPSPLCSTRGSFPSHHPCFARFTAKSLPCPAPLSTVLALTDLRHSASRRRHWASPVPTPSLALAPHERLQRGLTLLPRPSRPPRSRRARDPPPPLASPVRPVPPASAPAPVRMQVQAHLAL